MVLGLLFSQCISKFRGGVFAQVLGLRLLPKFTVLGLCLTGTALADPVLSKKAKKIVHAQITCSAYLEDNHENESMGLPQGFEPQFTITSQVDLSVVKQVASFSRLKDLTLADNNTVLAHVIDPQKKGSSRQAEAEPVTQWYLFSGGMQLQLPRLIENWTPKSKLVWGSFEGKVLRALDARGFTFNANLNCRVSKDSGTTGIETAVQAMQSALKEGRHTYFNYAGLQADQQAGALDAVRLYIGDRHPDFNDRFTYVENANRFSSDDLVAGTLSLGALSGRLFEGDSAFSEFSYEWTLFWLSEGADFGFDGWEQNGCAAPTESLLVISKRLQSVWSFDLMPCRE